MKQFMLPFPQDKELQDKRSYANGLHEQPLFSWLWDLLPQMLCRPLLWFCQYNSPGRSFLPDYIGKFNSVFSWGYGISLLEIFLEVFRDSCLNRHNRHVFFCFFFCLILSCSSSSESPIFPWTIPFTVGLRMTAILLSLACGCLYLPFFQGGIFYVFPFLYLIFV